MHKLFLLALLPFMITRLISASEIPPVMGDWQGQWKDYPENSMATNSPNLAARVVGLGDDTYLVQIMEEVHKRAHLYFEAPVKADEDGRLVYEDDKWSFEAGPRSFTGTSSYGSPEPVKFALEKVERLSPTLGREAPKGAVILFDGINLEGWRHASGGDATWLVLEDEKAFECLPRSPENEAGGDLMTRDKFGDCEIHMEFKIPYLPEGDRNLRGNSGIYLQGLYEIQIIDSYGAVGDWRDCGSLYKVAPPKVNMSAPPGQWQTFDIVFRAARYNTSSKLVQEPVVSVSHNGKLIHTNLVLDERTSHRFSDRILPAPKDPGVILLQDHGYHVQFRNFWVRRLN